MDDKQSLKYLVAIVGAGPAGLFAARQLALAGARVVVFNRDVKPGGLAEYGIFPDKHKMKEGLRKQFRNLLAMPQIEYWGNVTVGQDADLTLDDLRAFGFQAILVTVGAQGTKWLGLPGEELLLQLVFEDQRDGHPREAERHHEAREHPEGRLGAFLHHEWIRRVCRRACTAPCSCR